MTVQFGMLMDPIDEINIKKDSSFALLLAAQSRGWDIFYIKPDALWLQNGVPYATLHTLKVKDDPEQWFTIQDTRSQPLEALDVLMMRKDPPFNMDYIYLTYLLELAEARGVGIINKPASLRDANEKLFASWFPQCCPNTLVSANAEQLKTFASEEKEIVIKPLDGMGGHSIFRVTHQDPNLAVIIENMTQHGKQLVMAQHFIPAYRKGDKRVLMVDGKPIPYALKRIPPDDDFRGNLAIGATAEGYELTERDRWICNEIGPTLKAKGLLLVGLDIIGDYLTEINVTSPTCIREIEAHFNVDITGQILDAIQSIT